MKCPTIIPLAALVGVLSQVPIIDHYRSAGVWTISQLFPSGSSMLNHLPQGASEISLLGFTPFAFNSRYVFSTSEVENDIFITPGGKSSNQVVRVMDAP